MRQPTAEDIQAACSMLETLSDVDDVAALNAAPQVGRLFQRWLDSFDDEEETVLRRLVEAGS